jgi:hypothetical protein
MEPSKCFCQSTLHSRWSFSIISFKALRFLISTIQPLPHITVNASDVSISWDYFLVLDGPRNLTSNSSISTKARGFLLCHFRKVLDNTQPKWYARVTTYCWLSVLSVSNQDDIWNKSPVVCSVDG